MSDLMPTVLYKFFPEARYDFFDNPKLRFSPLKTLNDPFEGQNSLDAYDTSYFGGPYTAEEAEIINESIREKAKEFPIDGLDIDRIAIAVPGGLPPNTYIRSEDGKRLQSGSTYVEEYYENIGVLSLSGPEKDKEEEFLKKNILIWSHYAESHKGFAVGLNPKHQFFDRSTQNKWVVGNIAKVSYVEKRPLIRFEDMPKKEEFFTKLLLTKGNLWEYESEYRLIIDCVKAFNVNNCIGLQELHVEAITSVYIGMNATKENEEKVKTFCKQYPFITVYKMYPHRTEYECEMCKLS